MLGGNVKKNKEETTIIVRVLVASVGEGARKGFGELHVPFLALEDGYMNMCSLSSNSSNCILLFYIFFCIWGMGLMK